MNTTDTSAYRNASRQTVCATIALLLTMGLTWSFVASTSFIRWPGSHTVTTAGLADYALPGGTERVSL